ncbi:5-oxoprolinase subunit PxpA [Sphaerobacter sp.]|uniref:LamB/YcsF family protein n=1 Tax=Sphaerobacter sp. TaxID=2099654 RepID=UPI001DF9BEA2|nr:5-oxoprolinase subunit PxpA [Sphaerobacter sp.]MBX5445714.1 LamB/YcsF family protein [Sphaerobacter sp.]
MAIRMDINSDMGESFGRYTIGNDAELMTVITSANIACGWHGGDPAVMRETVALAVQHGVGIGAHVALPDLLGFGRRRMEVSPQEIYDYTLYQAGALAAFAEAAGGRLQHVKPHGAFYVMCAQNPEYADALARAVKALGDDVILVMMGDVAPKAAAAHGVPYMPEGYIDLNYNAQGGLVLERSKQAWDPDEVANRAVQIATQKTVNTIDGTTLPMDVKTLCIHGDAPNSGEVARRVRQRLEAAGVEIVPMREMRG